MYKCFLTIDVEGGEEEVMQSSDWNTFRPILMIVEDITGNNLALDWLIKALGYKCNNRLTYSNVYVKENPDHSFCGSQAICRTD